jgi:hypothetical protein
MACRKPFDPESIQGFSSALIVEGVVNPTGPTNIYLTRTQDLDDKAALKPELKATVQILSENNTAITLTDRGAGLYSISQLTLNSAQKYRLKIKTASGTEYISDPMPVKNTPAIDKLYWERGPEGVGIYIDAHDSQNNTKYYRWDFEEDWEIRSIDSAKYRIMSLVGGGAAVVSRDPKESLLMYTCYKHQRSNSIDIFSTAKLTTDVVSRHPIVFITNNSEKLGVKYSIVVRQYAIPFEAFEYLSMMKRNSEQLGSFFDSQPSELIGNIRNVNDANDVAIGYIVIAPVVEKSIFISSNDVPAWGFKLSCSEINVKNNKDSIQAFFSSNAYLPRYTIQNNSGAIEYWNGTSVDCMDCRSRGGDNNKPSFW